MEGERGEFVTVVYPGAAPGIVSSEHGVKVGEDEVTLYGEGQEVGENVVTVKRGGKDVMALSGKEIDLNRSQGDIGLFVPDAGYPFGEIPDWLIRQRGKRAH